VTRTPSRPVGLRGKVFRGSEQVSRGLLTPAQLRSTAWQRLFPDVYACASLPVDHGRRAVAAARLLVPTATVSGRSAAVLWGVDLAGPQDDVELTLDPTCRAGAVRGIRVTRRALTDAEVALRSGVRITTPLRTALDLARILPTEQAVICLDRFTVAGAVALPAVRRAAATLGGSGCRQVRTAVGLADGLAESPQETRVRLLLHASPLPRPVAQYTVRDGEGRFVGRVDFAWPDARVAVEYEGAWHAHNVGRDRRRLNELTAAGWTVVFVTAADLADPVALVARIGAALAARRYA
jgi:uncharacterized protein DUF559